MLNSQHAKEFLGRGWKFPVCVDETTGRIKTSSYEEDIKEAIEIIIMTSKGERMMRSDFGCDIQSYLFGGTDYTAVSQMEREVLNSLISYEPRITDIDVKITAAEADAGALSINISYVVRATNNPYNLVYPYFLNEGF